MELQIPELGTFYQTPGGGMDLHIPTDALLNIIRDKALKAMDVVGDEFGIYQGVQTDRYSKAKFARISQAKHVLTGKKDCDTWTSKGKMAITKQEVQAYPYELMSDHCNDVFTDCWRYIRGTGNDMNNLAATPEGQMLLSKMLDNMNTALSNSIYNVATFSNSDVITDSDTNSWWGVSATEWADFKDQQTATAARGHLTLMEDYKAADVPNFAVDIDSVTFTNGYYGGTNIVTDVFEPVRRAASTYLKVHMKRKIGGPVYLASPSIWEALEDYYLTTYKQIPDVYMHHLNRGGMMEPMARVLKYKGNLVICMDEWGVFDEITGTEQHRLVLTVPNNLGVAYDVQDLKGHAGTGLIVQQSTDIRDKGKLSFYTALELGADIIDPDLMVNASKIVTPS